MTQVWGRQHWSDLVPTLSTKHISRFLRRLENQGLGRYQEKYFSLACPVKKDWGKTIWRERTVVIGRVTVREPWKCLAATSEQQSNYHTNNRWHTSPWAGNTQGPKKAESRVTNFKTPQESSEFLGLCIHIMLSLWQFISMMIQRLLLCYHS